MQTVLFRFTRNNKIETHNTDSVETAILTFRREIKRRAKVDRAERGSFSYSIDGGNVWLR